MYSISRNWVQIPSFLYEQGSICETQKGPHRPPIRKGIDYLAYANALENENRYFWPI